MDKDKLKKNIFIVFGCILLFIIMMFIMASCTKKKYSSQQYAKYVVERATSYYSLHKDSLPKNNGEKTSINVDTLVEKPEKLLGKENTCNGSVEVINNNGFYMYSPNISCSDGYKTTKLADFITQNDKIVTNGNGLYYNNGIYYFRGDTVDNYIIFNKQLWRIIQVNLDGSIKIIETNYAIKNKDYDNIQYKSNKRVSSVWDNRYNTDKTYTSGFNDYIHENVNSRIKDLLENIYNDEFSEDIKGYIVEQTLCVGKRAETDIINDGSIECSETIESQYIGLLQLNEYINASLDTNCQSAQSITCSNYNFLATFQTSFWTITPVKGNTYEAYKVGNKITSSTTSSSATPRIVINLSNSVTISQGDGTYEKPFIIN